MGKTSNIVLDDWQKEILNTEGNVLLCTGRQVGKTTIFAIKAAKRLLKKANQKIIVVSLTEDQAKLIIIMILDYLEKYYNEKIKKGKDKPTQNRIRTKNGSEVLARPVGTTGDAVRGFTGDVLIIDEASRMPELVWTASKPTLLTTAGEIWICSTPKGKQGMFYEFYLNKEQRFKVFHISSEEVIKNRPIRAGWTEEKREKAINFLKQERADMSELEYGQEYLGLFLDELRQFFPDELIAKVCTAKRPEQMPQDDLYLGADIARYGGDECSYEIIYRKEKRDKEYFKHIENITKKEQPTTKTEQDILDLNKKFNLNKIGIDAGAGSLGVGIYDRFQENPETSRKVIAMNNRQISVNRNENKQRLFKEDMYDLLLSAMEKGEIELLDDEDVRISLKSVQWELTNDKGITKVRIFGTYTHIAEGLVRAYYLAKKEKSLNLKIYYI